MVARRTLTRAAIVFVTVVAPALWYACADRGPDAPAGPSITSLPNFRDALSVQRRHTQALLEIPGVVGTAVTGLPDGRASVLLLAERSGITDLPVALDGVPVTVRVTGRIMAFSDPKTRKRPAPLGYSVGHPNITAGTIGARVRDALGRVYILSNNHVLAHSNGATIGDAALQPGPIDGGTAADQIATLSDFQTLLFGGVNNTMDAAIALSSVDVLDNAVPSDDGYGMPNSTIYGDANGDGLFDDPNALLGLNVQKYGRTTKLTHGQISGVNATVQVCYEVVEFVCTKIARFVNQLIISPAGFSNGGDSGSLIVTDDENLNPVALLFAGSATVTIGNRIDLVLNRFGVTIDGFAPPPPGPRTDLAVMSVNGPPSAMRDNTVPVTVIVKNVGNQDVSAFVVTLEDTTEHVTLGTPSVSGLAPGASTTLSFAWTPTTTGNHDLIARHNLVDDNATNNLRSSSIPVIVPVTDVAVTGFNTPPSVIVGHTVNIGVTVQNTGNLDVPGSFTVTLRDSTAGVTLGTQTVTGFATGAITTLVFSWNATDAALGLHRLVATHSLSDDDASNNRIATLIPVIPKPVDIAATDITAPRSVAQGDTAHVVVTVKNVGEVDVATTFAVVLTDGWEGATVGTGTVAGLAMGATATVEIAWHTAGAAVAGHTLFATQQLADDKPENNSIGISVQVTAPPPPGPPPPPPPPPPSPADLAVSGISAPARVNQGDVAPVTVTVQHVSGVAVTANFDVVLTDGYNGPIIGTQTIAGLAAGASATLTFNWNTTGVALDGHTLFATQKLTDNNAANNSMAIGVIIQAPPTTDIAVAAVSAPAVVTQGSTAVIAVTVQNVGGLNVGSNFDIVLTDVTAGVTIGTQTIAGLAIGANTTRSFNWSTATAALGGHTLVATHTLTDANAANNQGTATVTVNPPTTDVAVTSVTAPGSVQKGSTATIGVTVQNVGGLNVGSFNVVLTDATAGVTIGTQTVTALAINASATRSFSWNTGPAAVGSHTLVATQTLTDDNATNNTRSVAVTVNPAPADLAVTAVTAPGQVSVGDTAPVVVTVQNVGGQDVTASFDVVLTDGTAGNAVIGAQTIPGLALGASVTRTFNWNTTGAVIGGHILTATQKLADASAGNNARAVVVTVNPPSVHVGNLDGFATNAGSTWSANVRITAHDSRHNPVNGVTVRGSFNSGPELQCITSDVEVAGTCVLTLAGLPITTLQAYFGMNGMTHAGSTYKPALNHDPDGSSNGFGFFVRR
jgi:subtilase family serine protease